MIQNPPRGRINFCPERFTLLPVTEKLPPEEEASVSEPCAGQPGRLCRMNPLQRLPDARGSCRKGWESFPEVFRWRGREGMREPPERKCPVFEKEGFREFDHLAVPASPSISRVIGKASLSQSDCAINLSDVYHQPIWYCLGKASLSSASCIIAVRQA